MSRRQGQLSFLHLPAELRNYVYDLVLQAEESCDALPGLALTQLCRQVRSEYRPFCLKRKVTINWENIPGYIRTFYPMSDEGKADNIELAPSRMTILLPDPFTDTALINIAFLPIIKMGISNPSFTCKFRLDKPASMLIHPHYEQGWSFWESEIRSNSSRVSQVVKHRGPVWIAAIESKRLNWIVLFCNGTLGPNLKMYVDEDEVPMEDWVVQMQSSTYKEYDPYWFRKYQ